MICRALLRDGVDCFERITTLVREGSASLKMFESLSRTLYSYLTAMLLGLYDWSELLSIDFLRPVV